MNIEVSGKIRKRNEKEGREWQADYLPGAFKEAEELIQKARERKGF